MTDYNQNTENIINKTKDTIYIKIKKKYIQKRKQE